MAGASPKQRVVDSLCERYAEDHITLEELERRLDLAHSATTARELEAVLADLPRPAPAPTGAEGVAERRGPASAAAAGTERRVAKPASIGAHALESENVVAVFGATSRKGRWRPARKTFTLALFGGADLDLREAELPPGVTEITVVAAWGGVDIIVHPDLAVELGGMAVFGGFDQHVDGGSSPAPEPGSPILQIKGLAFMGGVDVKARYPGETPREAKRRRRLEKKEQRRLAKRGGRR